MNGITAAAWEPQNLKEFKKGQYMLQGVSVPIFSTICKFLLSTRKNPLKRRLAVLQQWQRHFKFKNDQKRVIILWYVVKSLCTDFQHNLLNSSIPRKNPLKRVIAAFWRLHWKKSLRKDYYMYWVCVLILSTLVTSFYPLLQNP